MIMYKDPNYASTIIVKDFIMHRTTFIMYANCRWFSKEKPTNQTKFNKTVPPSICSLKLLLSLGWMVGHVGRLPEQQHEKHLLS